MHTQSAPQKIEEKYKKRKELKILRAIVLQVENFDFKFLRILISLFKRNENVCVFRFPCISVRATRESSYYQDILSMIKMDKNSLYNNYRQRESCFVHDPKTKR